MQQAGVVFAQFCLPQVESAFEGRQVIEAFAVFGEDGRRHVGRVGREAHDAVFDAVQFDIDFLGSFLLVGLVILLVVFLLFFFGFACGFFFLGLLLFGFQLLEQFVVFLVQAEAVIGVLVEEDEHGVAQRAPGCMAAHAVAVGLEEDGVAVEHPAGRLTEIAALGQVDDVPARTVGFHQAYVRVGVVTVADECEGEPASVGRPGVIKAASCVVPRRAVSHLAHFFSLQIDHHQAAAVFDEGQFLAVGRELRVGALDVFRGQQGFFLDERSVGEIGIFRAGDFCKIESPVASTLAGIGQGAVVRGE